MRCTSFWVVDDHMLPHCMLLGMDFLSANVLSINFAKNQVTQVLASGRGTCTPILEFDSVECLGLKVLFADNRESLNNYNSGSDLQCLFNLVKHEVPGQEWPQELMKYVPYRKVLRIEHNQLVKCPQNTRVLDKFKFIAVAKEVHENMAHIGGGKLLDLLQKSYWYPGMDDIVKDICSSCTHCQTMKIDGLIKKPPILKIKSQGVFNLVAVDLIKFPVSRRGSNGCLVLIDHCSKWAVCSTNQEQDCGMCVEYVEGQNIAISPQTS